MRNETVEITLSNRDESYRLIVQLIIFNSHFPLIFNRPLLYQLSARLQNDKACRLFLRFFLPCQVHTLY